MTNRLTAKEIEAIRKRAENATEGFWSSRSVQLPGYSDFGVYVSDTQICELSGTKNPNANNDMTFIRSAHEDIPKLLAEVERLKTVIRYVNDCAEEFYEEENGDYVIPQDTPNRDFLQEIFVISAEEVDE